MRPAPTSIAPLADGLALLSLGGGDAGGPSPLEWDLGCSRPAASAVGAGAPGRPRLSRTTSGAGASTSTEGGLDGAPTARRAGDMRGGALFQKRKPPPPPPAPTEERTLVDVIAGALARALSQSAIHPLDTLKVRMQTNAPLSKFGKLVPPPGARGPRTWSKRALLRHGVRYRNRTAVALSLSRAAGEFGSLYQGVFGAATGAGIIIGTYFAFYSSAKRALTRPRPDGTPPSLGPGSAAFLAGSAAAAGSSVVKVPLAVCIRSVQAGVYPNVFAAASSITKAAGVRGLFTGFTPTLLEDVPDMGVKFAVYEALRAGHAALVHNTRPASAGEDFAMGAVAGAVAAAATTPLDVVKTTMMCAAAARPSMATAARDVLARAGPGGFFAGVGPRALSNGLNSAVFFCLFEAIRTGLGDAARAKEEAAALEAKTGGGGGKR